MLTGNTIIITGGSSGVGLELASNLAMQNNTVIICGRSEQKLSEAKIKIPTLITYACDIADATSCQEFARWTQQHFPDCNILINNAAIAHTAVFLDDEHAIDKATQEFQTNTLAPIRLTKLLTPLLLKNKQPMLITISTGLVYAPKTSYPFYNATKAALHSFTQTLRMQTQKSNLNVIEVFLPVVDTPWHKGPVPTSAISVTQAVKEILAGVDQKKTEIRVAKVKLLYWLARLYPALAVKIINRL